jgi:ABC-type nitrate/sulfonate/bicarbonate transport system substrate-binding protein
MKLRIFCYVFLLASSQLVSHSAHGVESPYKIRIGFPSLAFSYMPFYVAQEKGFYKKYNIESEYIQMTTTIQPQAVVAGNINYFTSVSTGISAALAGLPLVMVINFCDVSPWVLVTHKDINKPQDLIGKTVALSGIRTSPYYFFQAFLKKSEINDKEVQSISTGGTADSFRALTTNRVVGTVLTPPFDDKAVSLGYKKFMQLGDLADIPYVGLVTWQRNQKQSRVGAPHGNRRDGIRCVVANAESQDDRRYIQGEPNRSGKHLRDADQDSEQRRPHEPQSRPRLSRHPAPGASYPGRLRPNEADGFLHAAG